MTTGFLLRTDPRELPETRALRAITYRCGCGMAAAVAVTSSAQALLDEALRGEYL